MASSSSSSSSSVQPKHQVFLSFRGEDTRNNFVSHLHEALKRKGIGYFIDYQLVRGEEISQALLTAIEKSKISIIVLSKNYASSSWCLDELSKILECKKRYGQEVVPIFYHVDPSEVRYQKGSFEQAFAKHQQRFREETDKVESWRAALKEVANLSGYHIQPDLPESTLIAEIVKDISKKLMYKALCDTRRLVGIDSHTEALESLLCFDSADVRIIGITGMGGIGKTTIAEVVYNLFFDEFDGFCFINVEEELHGGPGGQVRLREKLFSKILADENLNLPTKFLPSSILDRLYCKKIFIVLDDVNHSTQLLDLLPEKQLFKPGSRIIVLSRDKQVLQQVVDVIDVMYEVEAMIDDEALHLFCMYAFKQSQPKEDFVELSKKVIHYVKGLPLALRVVGSALYRRSKRDWEGYLIKLKESSDLEIDEVLKISYDGLDDEVKNIFLDIACFFRWELTNDVENILNGCYISVTYGIRSLVDKSLITVLDNKINMHDLVQLMAWNIIRQESKEPGKRSRLWTPEDIYDVLKNNTGTKSIEGMFLDMSKIGKLCLSPTTFEKMCNLRLLNFYYTGYKREGNVYLSQQDLEYLPDSLRYLHWDDYPLKSLPSSFCPMNLVELSMPNSHVEQLWNGVQDLVKLKILNMRGSKHLIKIPDLSRATNLESMKLDGCRSLVEVASSIRYLNKLSYLDLSGCQNLGNFPRNVGLRSLTILLLTNCSNITKFPEISTNLKILYLNGTAIEEVPSSIDRLFKLEILNMTNCKRLERLPNNICKLKINDLNLVGCLKLKSFPEILETMEYLYQLDLSYTSIEELPSSIEHLVHLYRLKLDYCEKLKNLPSSIMELKSLLFLSLINCSNFTQLPEIPSCVLSLNLSGSAIEQLPSSIEPVSRLMEVYLENCAKLHSLPRNIFKLKNLREFEVSGFSKVEVVQELLGTIEALNIRPSGGKMWSKAKPWVLDLDELPDNVENLESLRSLYVDYCNPFAFPIRLTCISSITSLTLSGNNFETIPASIKNLLKLKDLRISFCKGLKSLPELPPNLQVMSADSCSSLEEVSLSSLFTLHGSRIEYSFANCLKLNQKAIRDILAKTQLWIQHGATADLKLDCQVIFGRSSLTLCLPGSEIPEWVSCQNTGSSVPIQPLPYDRKFVGFVLCTVVALREDRDERGWVDVNCKLNFKTNDGRHYAASRSLGSYFITVGSDHMCLDLVDYDGTFVCLFNKRFGVYDGFSEPSFEFYTDENWARVKKCGVHALYRQNDQIICSHTVQVIQPSSPFDSTVLSLNSGVIDQEPMQEDGTIIKRRRDAHHNNKAEPSKSLSSEQEEEKPYPKRLKRIIMTNRTLLFKSKRVVRRRPKRPRSISPR